MIKEYTLEREDDEIELEIDVTFFEDDLDFIAWHNGTIYDLTKSEEETIIRWLWDNESEWKMEAAADEADYRYEQRRERDYD